MHAIKTTAFAALLIAAFALPAAAQDAMAPATDAMAPATDAMAPMAPAMDAMAPMMSDADLAMCIEQATAITFPDVAMVAEQACHTMHNGHSPMAGDAMGSDAMSTDAMSTDAMAPKP